MLIFLHVMEQMHHVLYGHMYLIWRFINVPWCSEKTAYSKSHNNSQSNPYFTVRLLPLFLFFLSQK